MPYVSAAQRKAVWGVKKRTKRKSKKKKKT